MGATGPHACAHMSALVLLPHIEQSAAVACVRWAGPLLETLQFMRMDYSAFPRIHRETSDRWPPRSPWPCNTHSTTSSHPSHSSMNLHLAHWPSAIRPGLQTTPGRPCPPVAMCHRSAPYGCQTRDLPGPRQAWWLLHLESVRCARCSLAA